MERNADDYRHRERSKQKHTIIGSPVTANGSFDKRNLSPNQVAHGSHGTSPVNIYRKTKTIQAHPHQSPSPSPVAQLLKEEREKLVLMDLDLDSVPNLYCYVDFTKPDALRNKILVVESRSLYVCDYYLSIWSPIFREMFFGPAKQQSTKEVVLPGKRFHHVLEFLECIYPQQKDITEQNLNIVLPLAYEFQSEGLMRRCMEYIRGASMKLMDKLLLADSYNLLPLLNFCLKQLRINAQVDFNSEHYEALSDRTKVRLLEKLQHCRSDYGPDVYERIPELDNTEPDPTNFAKFTQKSELYFGILRIKNGRYFYCNPYYVAAWSRKIFDQVTNLNQTEINSSLNEEEAVNFLMASHPPMMRLADNNASTVLKAACKLEAPGMVRSCSGFLLLHSKSSDFYETFALFDRCYLHELLEPCLRRTKDLSQALKFATHPTYDCLSARAKACIMDRIAFIMASEPDLTYHYCDKCRRRCACQAIKWVCAHCGTYHSGEKVDTIGRLF